MNFLAHLYLSGDDENIMIGNFIADHVKGNNFLPYNERIIQGIKLHRLIDAFTDTHPVVEESKKRLRPNFHKYAPVIVDVFYDYFLARNWKEHHSLNLEQFVNNAYSVLNRNEMILSARTSRMLQFMTEQNWLYHYSTLEGIDKALTGMSRRTRFKSNMDKATLHLKKNHEKFQTEFNLFFPQLKSFCLSHLNQQDSKIQSEKIILSFP